MNTPYDPPGSDLEAGADMRPCKRCAKEVHITAATCPHCGANQRSRMYNSKTTAALLALFLGGVGIHRFYLGQWWGIFYLLMVWTLIPIFVALVEFVVFLACDQVKWDQKHNQPNPK